MFRGIARVSSAQRPPRQRPRMQFCLPWHFLPQPPQFMVSKFVLMQAPEQREKPESHTVLQPLLEQTELPLVTVGQTVPQPPQLSTSVLVSTQASVQRMY